MPKTEVRIYREIDGKVPLLDWLDDLPDKARDKCVAVIMRLADFGNQLRRPDCDYLTDGIYELRARVGNINYRILYGFTDKQIVLLSHGCTKEKKVPVKEINKAIENLQKYRQNPKVHTCMENIL
jgi:putative component of toxin-antitoxin plasmid stabilization module